MSSTSDFDRQSPAPLAELFHENSKLPPRVSSGGLTFGQAPSGGVSGNIKGKSYRTAERTALPPLDRLGTELSETLTQRRSIRTYQPHPMALSQIAQLLGWGYGLWNRPKESLRQGRSAPSAGGLYPIELYLAARRVSDLNPGVYHYDAKSHALEAVVPANAFNEIHTASLYPEILAEAAAYLMMVAVFARTCDKYGERGYRFVMLDCGHVAQNLHLISTAIGVGSVGIGGFHDDALNDVLGLDGVDEAVVHTMALGVP